jgi:hypothetical protein
MLSAMKDESLCLCPGRTREVLLKLSSAPIAVSTSFRRWTAMLRGVVEYDESFNWLARRSRTVAADRLEHENAPTWRSGRFTWRVTPELQWGSFGWAYWDLPPRLLGATYGTMRIASSGTN